MERFNREKHPANSKHHDVLVITPDSEFFKYFTNPHGKAPATPAAQPSRQ